jgi:hypothetical protein
MALPQLVPVPVPVPVPALLALVALVALLALLALLALPLVLLALPLVLALRKSAVCISWKMHPHLVLRPCQIDVRGCSE